MKRKSGFFTFCLAFCPGAGQMYQGYMKRGTSLLVLFMLIIMLGTLLNMVPVALFSLVVWMYSFFDTFNIRSRFLSGEAMEPDAWLVDPESLAGGNWKTLVEKRHRVLGIALVAIGVYALYSNFIAPVLWGMVSAYHLHWLGTLLNSLTTTLVAVVLIGFGVFLMRGPAHSAFQRRCAQPLRILCTEYTGPRLWFGRFHGKLKTRMCGRRSAGMRPGVPERKCAGVLKNFTKQEKSWMMYDWANSAHSVIVVTILPIFYNTVVEYMADAASGMTTWGYATSAAMAIVALLAPVLGVFGDFRGMRKKLFAIFMLVGVVSCVGLAVTPQLDFMAPGVAEKVGMAVLALYILSTIGFAGANLYYDSFLNDVTTEERMDKVSTMGYGLGYIGGSTIPLLAFLIMNLILGSDAMLFCLSFAFGLTAVWWFVFSFPLLKNVEQVSYVEREKGAVGKALKGLWATVKEIFHHKEMFVFLIAYFFYIDGVNTIIHMSTSYGDTLGLDSTSMLLALLLVQVLGLPFCLLYIKASERFGARAMVGVGICIYMGVTVFGFFLREVWQFWVMAVMVATSQGGIQALSRSMFGKMIPDKKRTGEFFGFYDIFGKFSAIMGPALVGWSSALAAGIMLKNAGETRATASEALLAQVNMDAAPWGILSVLIIFFIGGGLYFFVLPKYRKKKG